MNYLFDVFIVSLPLLTAYATLLFFLYISLYVINRHRTSKGEPTFSTKGKKRLLFLPVVMILFLSATSGTVTWKNSLNTTESSIREINQYNRERVVPKIVDTTKQPGANSEALKKEMEEKTQSWKNNSDSEKRN